MLQDQWLDPMRTITSFLHACTEALGEARSLCWGLVPLDSLHSYGGSQHLSLKNFFYAILMSLLGICNDLVATVRPLNHQDPHYCLLLSSKVLLLCDQEDSRGLQGTSRHLGGQITHGVCFQPYQQC